jgi:UDP-N-acetylglucosamine acyltransferase
MKMFQCNNHKSNHCLLLKKLNISRALDIIETEREPTEIRDEILDFIRNSNRGVMKGFGNS